MGRARAWRGAGVALGALLLAAGVVAAAGGALSCAHGPAFPGDSWRERDPEDVGLDPDRLEALAVELGGSGMVVLDGVEVKRWGDPDHRQDWLSAAKPVFATLLLFAVEEGRLESVDAEIAPLGWKLRPADRGITFRQLANMTSGYARPEGPGEAWSYNDHAVALFQRSLFDRVFRTDPTEVLRDPDRLGALDFEDEPRLRSRRRRLRASVRDYARVAWWWMQEGRWRDRQLLPADVLEAAMRPQVPADLPETDPAAGTDDYLRAGTFGGGSDHFTRFGPGIYGFGWWFNATGRRHPDARTWPDAPADTVMAIGARGNCAALFPGLGAVVVAADADWGALEAGSRRSRLNRVLARAAQAVARPGRGDAGGDEDPGGGVAGGGTAGPSEDADAPAVELAGRLRVWHPVTLTLRGPRSAEDADPNPFRDVRLDVTFRHGDRRIRVPGHFAADGRAAETGATAGDRWRVRFTPDAPGTWRWEASLRRGGDVATRTSPTAGVPAQGDGRRGRFEVAPAGALGEDPRARGRLEYVGRHHLRWTGTGEWFLKGGANSPENWLAYHEFDATRPTHRYAPHVRDHRSGDPTWRGGRGRGIVGAVNYLADRGMNAIYFLTQNVGGDGDDVWPWTGPDVRDRYDVSKLDQWEIVFDHMDRRGVMLHVVLQEQENDQLLDGGALGPERRVYHRELVSRFGHHRAVTWNLGEETSNSDAERRDFAAHLRDLDPWDHPVSVHTRPNRMDGIYGPLLGFAPVTAASLQSRRPHADTLAWVERSARAGHPWVVSLDEIGPSGAGVVPDDVDPTHDGVRRDHLWPSLLAGGAGVEWYFGYRFPHDDLDLEDWGTREAMWAQTRIALDFFREHLPFAEMASCDERLARGARHCLGAPGAVYAVQVPAGADDGVLDVGAAAGTFGVAWLDPRDGGPLHPGGVTAGPGPVTLGAPPEPGRDWIALVRARSDGAAPAGSARTGDRDAPERR